MKAGSPRVNPSFVPAQDMVAGRARDRHVVHMAAKDKEREERLAAALRDNLRRRKAQARELKAPGNAPIETSD